MSWLARLKLLFVRKPKAPDPIWKVDRGGNVILPTKRVVLKAKPSQH